MTTDVSKNLFCIVLRGGMEVWLEQDRATALQDVLQRITSSKFIMVDDQTLNTADITGVFKAATMADATRRKNGQWSCQHGGWHDKGEQCGCIAKDEAALIAKRMEAIKACGKCTNGFILTGVEAAKCECQMP